MNELEAQAIILEYLTLRHDIGEAFWSGMQMWISGSFAVILTAHFAPQRINLLLGSALGIIYIAFSLMILGNALGDLRQSALLLTMAESVAETHAVDRSILANTAPEFMTYPFLMFPPLMFFGTLIYLGYVSYATHKQQRTDA